MDADRIKNEIYRRGYSIGMIAEVIDRSPSLISKVINKKAKSHSVAHAIARIVELDIAQVFPNIYENTVPSRKNNNTRYKEKKIELAKLLEMSEAI